MCSKAQEYDALAGRYDAAFDKRSSAAREYLKSHNPGHLDTFKDAQLELDNTRKDAAAVVRKATGESRNDTNYIFLTFVTRYLPAGIVGLIMAAIFAAAMSTISAEVNSLATVSVIDIYRRHFRKDATDRHYLRASQAATAFWCLYAIVTAQFGANLGSLIEAVNILGSFFYGAAWRVRAGVLFSSSDRERRIYRRASWAKRPSLLLSQFTDIAFLWYNVIGCLIVVATGLIVSAFARPAGTRP